MPSSAARRTAPALAVALAVMLLAVMGGLERLGMPMPATPVTAVAMHGALLVWGFLGVLISVERAVVARREWALLAPSAAAAGAIALLLGAGREPVAALFILAGLVLCALLATMLRREPTTALAVLLAGAVAWPVGAAAWLAGASPAALLAWWAVFPTLTIVGERIQFGKVAPRPAARPLAGILVGAVVAGAATTMVDPAPGLRLLGGSFVAIAAWLVIVDARHRSRRRGLLRFVATGIALAYAWLALAGVTWLAYAPVAAGPQHDAAVHALFLGFVMTMVVAHAPMIFPAITGIRIPYRPWFWAHLILLQAGLAARVAGDLAQEPSLARTGAALGGAALAWFVLATAASVLQDRLSDDPRVASAVSGRA